MINKQYNYIVFNWELLYHAPTIHPLPTSYIAFPD